MTQVKHTPHEQAGASSAWVMPWNAEELSNQSVRRAVELASMAFRETTDALDPQMIRDDLQTGRSVGLRCRRAITALSLVGMFSMAIVSLYQMGRLRHLPDPPMGRFHSDKVNASFRAYQYGVPDGTVAMTAHALNVVLAAFGGRGRARQMPWVPIVASGKAAVEAGLAVKHLFYRMPVVERSWCSFRVVDALVRMGTFALSLPEAIEAARARRMPDSVRRRL